jgi:hypothetical protein
MAQLQGADLMNAELQGADLMNAELQGAIIGQTRILAVLNPPGTHVFGIEPMFDKTAPNWDELEVMAETISISRREDYHRRIQQAKKLLTQNAKSAWEHNPEVIAKEAFTKVCIGEPNPSYGQASRLAAAQGFRRSYQVLPKRHFDFEPTPEYQTLLLDIDRTLCTLPECADLRDGIDGLDCKHYLQSPPKNLE